METEDEADMTKERKNLGWKIVSGVILAVQILLSAAVLGITMWVDFLPGKYMAGIALILLILLVLVSFFFFSGMKKNGSGKKWLYVKRTFGCLVSITTMGICAIGSAMLFQAGNTLDNIANSVATTDTVSAYVMKDDPAQDMTDAKDYVFAITEKYDYEHTIKAIQEIDGEIGGRIHTQTYDNVLDMVQVLYSGAVDAMLMNEAYVDVVESQDGYENFSAKTRTLYHHEEVKTVEPVQNPVEKDITKDPFVVYISGSDTRNLTLATSRSDVNILVVVNPATKQVLLVNTPRDYYVDTAACAGAKDKLTHCGIYGIDCSMATLGNLYDEHVDYYAQINFNGFKTLVDAVGGITIESEKTFRTSEDGFYINEGVNQLSGEVALSYVRERKAFADGDNSRGKHQMQAIEAIIKKASSGTTILSHYSDIMNSMEGMFTTSMSTEEIASLVKMQLSDLASWNVKSFAVSGKGGSTTTYSMPSKRSYVMYPDEAQVKYAETLINKVVAGEALTDADLLIPDEQN